MDFLLENTVEKAFSMIKYYFEQAKQRNNKSYLEIAASYCNDIIYVNNMPQYIKDKAMYLRGVFYLMIGLDEDDVQKEQYFLEAAKLFLELRTVSLHTDYDEFAIDSSLLDTFFCWNRQRQKDGELLA